MPLINSRSKWSMWSSRAVVRKSGDGPRSENIDEMTATKVDAAVAAIERIPSSSGGAR